MDSTDVVVVGAGVVGLAVARAFAQRGRETLVLESHERPGMETTSRNSGVIHSGIYYPAGSLKARLCLLGRQRLYGFCETRDIPHQRCGKLIVAPEAQVPALRALHQRAIANGVDDLTPLDGAQVRELEPEVRCAAALLSPSTGIVDVHNLLLALIADLEASGGALVLRTRVESARATGAGFVVTYSSEDSTSEIECKWLVNSAGLSALDLLQRIEGHAAREPRRAYYAKGNYFACHGVKPFRRLVYPMPNEGGLGVHATLDLDGTTRFGPDVEWVERPDYHVDPARAQSFYAAIREYWPSLPQGSLQPAYAGVRPKLVGPGQAAADFEVSIERSCDGGLVNLLGIESPGLTSSLALAAHVVAAIDTSGVAD